MNKEKIGVYIEPPKGGFGDVAPNLLMAQKFCEKYESVSVILHRRTLDQFEKLLPRFRRQLPFQHIEGLDIYLESNGPQPELDMLLSFSSRSRGPFITHDPYLQQLAPLRMAFFEPGPGPDLLKSASTSLQLLSDGSARMGCDLNLPSGVESNGLYLSEARPTPPVTRESLSGCIEKGLDGKSRTVFQNLGLCPNDQLGFIYSKFSATTEAYIAAAWEAENSGLLRPGRKIFFLRRHENLNIPPSSQNMVFLPYETMEFETSRAIVAHSELPLLVTGDTSLALALDFEKCFFYEANSWKSSVGAELYQKIRRQTAFPKEYAALLNGALMVDSYHPSLPHEDWIHGLSDLTYQTQFQKAISQIRSELSLVANVFRYGEVLRTLDWAYLASTGNFQQVVRYALEKARRVTQGPKDYHQLLAQGEFQLAALPLRESIPWFAEWLTSTDRSCRVAAQDFFTIGIRKNPRVYKLMQALLFDGSSAARKEILQLLYMIHSVSSSEDPMALSSTIATRLLNEHFQRQSPSHHPSVELPGKVASELHE